MQPIKIRILTRTKSLSKGDGTCWREQLGWLLAMFSTVSEDHFSAHSRKRVIGVRETILREWSAYLRTYFFSFQTFDIHTANVFVYKPKHRI